MMPEYLAWDRIKYIQGDTEATMITRVRIDDGVTIDPEEVDVIGLAWRDRVNGPREYTVLVGNTQTKTYDEIGSFDDADAAEVAAWFVKAYLTENSGHRRRISIGNLGEVLETIMIEKNPEQGEQQ